MPIVATPDRRWFFLTAGGHRPELAVTPDIRFHGTGSWVPMPPTTFPHGLVHWRVKPEVCGWQLPEPELVYDALCTGRPESTDVAGLVSVVS